MGRRRGAGAGRLLLFSLGCLLASAAAEPVYVKAGADGGAGCGSQLQPCGSIAEGLAAALAAGLDPQTGAYYLRLLAGDAYSGPDNTNIVVDDSKLPLILEGQDQQTKVKIDCQTTTQAFVIQATGNGRPRAEFSYIEFYACSDLNSDQDARPGTNAGAIYASNVSLSVNHCSFSEGVSESRGGAISAANTDLSVVNSTFDHNRASAYAGAIWTFQTKVAISHSEFVSNQAATGGAICLIAPTGSPSIQHGTFEDNNAQFTAGAIYVTGTLQGVLEVSDSVFDGNTAIGQKTCVAETCAGRGGAVAAIDAGLSAWNTTFRYNSAKTESDEFTRGGAIFMTTFFPVSLRLDNCTFEGNSADGLETGSAASGGAVYAAGVKPLEVVNSQFISNTASSENLFADQISRGGAFDLQDTRFSINNCIFNSNQVFGGFGGSLNLEVASRGQVTGCTFEGNRAYSTYIYKAQGGAISALTESRLNISHCSFVKNVAAPQYISSSSPLTYSGVGGAIIIQTAQLNVQSSYFELNAVYAGQFDSGSAGGAIALENSLPTTINNTQFVHNAAQGSGNFGEYGASGSGGAILAKFSAPTITDCKFSYNFVTAGGSGFSTGGALALFFSQPQETMHPHTTKSSSFFSIPQANPRDYVRLMKQRRRMQASDVSTDMPDVLTGVPIVYNCDFYQNAALGEYGDIAVHRAGIGGAISTLSTNVALSHATIRENLAHTPATTGIVTSFAGGIAINYETTMVANNITMYKNIAYNGIGDEFTTLGMGISTISFQAENSSFTTVNKLEREVLTNQILANTRDSFPDLMYAPTSRRMTSVAFEVSAAHHRMMNSFPSQHDFGAFFEQDHRRLLTEAATAAATADEEVSAGPTILASGTSLCMIGGKVMFVNPTILSNVMEIWVGNYLEKVFGGTSPEPTDSHLWIAGDVPDGLLSMTAFNANITVAETAKPSVHLLQLRLLNSTFETQSDVVVGMPNEQCVLGGSGMSNQLTPMPYLTADGSGFDMHQSPFVPANYTPVVMYNCHVVLGFASSFKFNAIPLTFTFDSVVHLEGVKAKVTMVAQFGISDVDNRFVQPENTLTIYISDGGAIVLAENSSLAIKTPTVVIVDDDRPGMVNEGSIILDITSQKLTIDGNFEQHETGQVQLAISKPSDGVWPGPFIEMRNNASLGGTINVTFIGQDLLLPGDDWSWKLFNFSEVVQDSTVESEVMSPPTLGMGQSFSMVDSKYEESVTITNMQCEGVAYFVDTTNGDPGQADDRSTLCPVCIRNSSCVFCNNMCLTKGQLYGQCQGRFEYVDNCCPQNCNDHGKCNSDHKCECDFFYTGDSCHDLSLWGAFLISGCSLVVMLGMVFALYFYKVRSERTKVVAGALEELRQGLLGADYAGGDYLSPTYIENLQQDLVLRDVLVDFKQIELEEKIGEGAFGDVWKATFRGAQVAVKMIKTHMFMDISDDDMEQIRKEAYLMSRLRHPNIVLIMGISFQTQTVTIPSEDDDSMIQKEKQTLCIITEYLNQGSLADILHGPSAIDPEIWSYELLLSCALQAARGMLYLHSHHPPVCHRDLKSSNLIVDDHWVVKVTDFGMSRIMPDDAKPLASAHSYSSLASAASNNNLSEMANMARASYTIHDWANAQGHGGADGGDAGRMSFNIAMTSNLGTVAWCAPEMFAQDPRTMYSVKVDIYSFGMVLYELWERKMPFNEYTSRFDIIDAVRSGRRPTISNNCPIGLRALIQRCWHQQPERRPNFQYVVRFLKDELGRARKQRGNRSTPVPMPSVLTSPRMDASARGKQGKQTGELKIVDRMSWGAYNWKRWKRSTSKATRQSSTDGLQEDHVPAEERMTVGSPAEFAYDLEAHRHISRVLEEEEDEADARSPARQNSLMHSNRSVRRPSL